MPNAEKRKELTRQIIIRVKEVIEDLSDKEVMDRMEAAGEQTSLATIRRIRAVGSEDAGFNYNLTVRPFAKVFLELSQKPVIVEDLDTDADKDRAALENLLQLKNLEKEALKKEIAVLEEKMAEGKAESQKKIDHLKAQIERQDKLIDNQNKILDDRKSFMEERRDFIYRLEAEKKQLRKIIAALVFFLSLALILIITALIVDKMNPDMGFFWLDGISALYNGQLTGAAFGVGL